MAMKAMLRQLISKWGVMSIDMVSAMDADMAVIKPDLTPDYVETEEVPAQDAQEGPTKAENRPEEAKVETPTPKAEKPQETAPRGPEGDAFAAAFFGGK